MQNIKSQLPINLAINTILDFTITFRICLLGRSCICDMLHIIIKEIEYRNEKYQGRSLL